MEGSGQAEPHHSRIRNQRLPLAKDAVRHRAQPEHCGNSQGRTCSQKGKCQTLDHRVGQDWHQPDGHHGYQEAQSGLTI